MHVEPHPVTPVAGMLLTGGNSRRMGFDKASISIEGFTSAERTAGALRHVVSPVIEVGPGRSGLAAVSEDPAGSGPLAAVSAGARALRRAGHRGPALVLACDLPLVTIAVLRMLASWPVEGSVVPVVGGWPQPLCARWSATDLASAGALVDVGERAMSALLERPGLTLLDETRWPGAVSASAFADVDTPVELDRLGLRWQPGTPGADSVPP